MPASTTCDRSGRIGFCANDGGAPVVFWYKAVFAWASSVSSGGVKKRA